MSLVPVDRDATLAALRTRIEHAHRDGTTVGLALLDIRHFRRLNRLHGIAAGDAVLAHVMGKLEALTAKSPFVRRTGNDEFCVIWSGIADVGVLAMMGSKLARELDESILVGEREIAVAVNVGVAGSPQGTLSAVEVFAFAEEALHRARALGEPFVLDDPAWREPEMQNLRLELELHEAFTTNRLQLHYQPKVDLRTGKPRGPEALLRWDSRELGAVSPERFVPIIEQGGHSLELARWVLNTAFRQCRQWGIAGVALNLSAAVVANPEAAGLIESALRIWGVAPERLTVEISETGLPRDMQTVARQLQPLRELGVTVSIDDFGTGSASLLQFRDLPADEIKIDREFTRDIVRDDANRTLCEHVIALAHRFGRSVVAEGVEDQPTLDLLRRLGCDAAQGYRIARPMAEAEFRQWLADFDPLRYV